MVAPAKRADLPKALDENPHSTGAVAPLSDRAASLPRAGFVRRLDDHLEDFTRMRVDALPERVRRIQAFHGPFAAATAYLQTRHDDHPPAVAADYLSRSGSVTGPLTWLQAQPLVRCASAVRSRRPGRREAASVPAALPG
jgi:hypothetical protein